MSFICKCQRCWETITFDDDWSDEEREAWFEEDDELKLCDDCEEIRDLIKDCYNYDEIDEFEFFQERHKEKFDDVLGSIKARSVHPQKQRVMEELRKSRATSTLPRCILSFWDSILQEKDFDDVMAQYRICMKKIKLGDDELLSRISSLRYLYTTVICNGKL